MGLPRDRDWLDVAPIEEAARSALQADPGRVIFVDVGGNAGHQCARLVERIPDLRGHVVLQDLEETIRKAPPVEGVRAEAYNFFTPQPVKGRYLLLV